MLDTLVHDVRHSFRLLTRERGVTCVAAATIGPATAAVAVMTSVVWGGMLQPLPWPEADRLIRVHEGVGGADRFGQFGQIFTNSTYLAWREDAATIDGIAAWRVNDVTLVERGSAERLRIASVTTSLATVLRAKPLIGRWFHPSEGRPGSGRVLLPG